ncbi:hypothetical protein EJ06DRAFT_208361 [Trichodelitschia bisporula]|uniref:Uncharacterized protein n=1 Tax=Trichodelitschia bisporula TaxID=703511 RepID=A0A6G1I923_9PEZI|nr:hypothetical protein EJ06DRAFT_208361 [Trichodelitschia bisporula]
MKVPEAGAAGTGVGQTFCNLGLDLTQSVAFVDGAVCVTVVSAGRRGGGGKLKKGWSEGVGHIYTPAFFDQACVCMGCEYIYWTRVYPVYGSVWCLFFSWTMHWGFFFLGC